MQAFKQPLHGRDRLQFVCKSNQSVSSAAFGQCETEPFKTVLYPLWIESKLIEQWHGMLEFSETRVFTGRRPMLSIRIECWKRQEEMAARLKNAMHLTRNRIIAI
ncbi:MAG: hypothetical protein A4S14_06870 [Proteobacteria bacterium SG_bin9]|nr:MAG: hypothetical protein A4S14_06870 [Proteobacteria bacterium SG_bin9]